jgi:hypothetical protein
VRQEALHLLRPSQRGRSYAVEIFPRLGAIRLAEIRLGEDARRGETRFCHGRPHLGWRRLADDSRLTGATSVRSTLLSGLNQRIGGWSVLAFLDFTLRLALTRESSQTISQMTHTPVAEACPSDNSLTQETCVLLRSEVANRRTDRRRSGWSRPPTSWAGRFNNYFEANEVCPLVAAVNLASEPASYGTLVRQ